MIPDTLAFSASREEHLRVYESLNDRGKVELYPSFSDSPLSSNATLVNDEDHLRADVCKLILPPPNQQSNDQTTTDTQIKPPTSQLTFNPSAAPFVPSQMTLYTTATHPPPALILQDKPSWLSSFWEGTTTGVYAEQRLHATRMVQARKWTFVDICSLAHRFSWQCATPDTYGPFARAVYDTLNDSCGTWDSSCFGFYLQKAAVDSFEHAWANLDPTKTDEDDYTFRISCFLAELYAVGLFPKARVHECFEKILQNMCSLEHIHVLWEMVVRGRESLWQGPKSSQLVTDFTHLFAKRTETILRAANIGPPTMIATKEANDVVQMIRDWHNQPSTADICMTQLSIWAYPES
ncbi:hypothetical protein EDC04DRAFT_910583 [Pisolithus marmoratus]|nr:hypothetical protein EDC04DRAFT_910583 [Pisolithus marmoratus]